MSLWRRGQRCRKYSGCSMIASALGKEAPMEGQRPGGRAKDRQLELLQDRPQVVAMWRQFPSEVRVQTLAVLAQLLSDAWAGSRGGLLRREADDE
jgi:Na+-translocating ferredoxin:NAD+ oxidoreductase RNF subunit RnfB